MNNVDSLVGPAAVLAIAATGILFSTILFLKL